MSLATLWTLLLRTYRSGGGGEKEGRGGGFEAAVALQSRLAPAVHAALDFHSCIALVKGPAMGWGGRRRLSAFSRVGAHHIGDELM